MFAEQVEKDECWQPQLMMRRIHLRNLRKVELPPGYSLRHFRRGDEPSWERIIRVCFERPEYQFGTILKADPAYRPDRVLFLTYKGWLVGTGSAWQVERLGAAIGYLHMVGVLPEFQGFHLGYEICLAVLHRFVEEGRMEAVLETDDSRLPAIKTYLRLGFEPLLVHENQRTRWWNILDQLEWNDDLVRLESILSGPIAGVAGSTSL